MSGNRPGAIAVRSSFLQSVDVLSTGIGKRDGKLAGAPGFEPGYGGIKIRCLTAWLRPSEAASAARPDDSGGAGRDQCSARSGACGPWTRTLYNRPALK